VTQATGQTSVLHDLAAKVSGHGPPLPAVGRSTLRVRDAVPPAHVTEQVAQLNQAPTMQSRACIEGEADGTVVGSSVGEAVVGLRTKKQLPSGIKFSRRARLVADHRTSATAMGSERHQTQ
jgi:hypothetical protein